MKVDNTDTYIADRAARAAAHARGCATAAARFARAAASTGAEGEASLATSYAAEADTIAANAVLAAAIAARAITETLAVRAWKKSECLSVAALIASSNALGALVAAKSRARRACQV